VSVLSDREIRKRCQGDKPMLNPLLNGDQRRGVISYGLSSAGYDLRLGGEILRYNSACGDVIDPKMFRRDTEFAERVYIHEHYLEGSRVVIPSGGYILGRAIERFCMPRDLVGIVFTKSTYARIGILPATTVIEPGWEGDLTFEISNNNPGPAVVYVGEGIAQVMFFLISGEVDRDYADRLGAYQGQVGVTPPRV
jgi:dCTP deaminase